MSGEERRGLIRQSAADAYLLITEIAKNGKTFDVAKIAPILEAMKLDDASLDKFDEAQFWTAVGYVSDVAKPLRADTVRRLAQLRSPLQFSTMNLYVWLIAGLSIAVLITTLIFLSLASVLQDKLAYLEKLRQDVATAQETNNAQNLNRAKYEAQSIYYSLYERDTRRYDRIAKLLQPEITLTPTELYAAVVANDQLQSYIKASSKDRLQTVQFYWLPVLLAILGSMVAILRSIYMSIEDASVDMLSLTMVMVRVTTGAIAGIAIGWIYKAGGADSIVAVTPFVLAFIAGYAVDLLFTLLDRITKALSDTPTRTPPAPAPS